MRLLGFDLTTGYTFNHVLDTQSDLATRASDQAQVNVGSFNVGLVRDRRDNALRPRHGYRISVQSELADTGGSPGGHHDTLCPSASNE